eukprot:m.105936 g.105936  ORF g.105936 m.105936 type:complete len:419 (+) comp16883_c0_seq1:318-1574(+)
MPNAKIPVSILGGTGLVGRALAERLLDHPNFKLGLVVGSASTAGKPFKDVWIDKEGALEKHYGDSLWTAAPWPEGLEDVLVSSTEDLLATSSDGHYVVSAIAPRLGKIEDQLQAAGFVVFSISPHARQLPENPLIVPEANGDMLLSAISARSPHQPVPLIKSPNCVTCGISVVLRALDDAYGVDGVAVTTFQALSGRGDAKYDPKLVLGQVYPLAGTAEKTGEYQRMELLRIFPQLKKCSVAAHRVPVQTGHFVDIKVQCRNKVKDAGDVARVLRSFNPLDGLDLPSQPAQPIIVCEEPGRPRSIDDNSHSNGMAVAAGNIRTDDGMFDITLSVVLNNVSRGAYGAALLNAELYDLHVAPWVRETRDEQQMPFIDQVHLGTDTEYQCGGCECQFVGKRDWCLNCGSDDIHEYTCALSY